MEAACTEKFSSWACRAPARPHSPMRSRRCSMRWCSMPTPCAPTSHATSASATRTGSSTRAAWAGCAIEWSRPAAPSSRTSFARPRKRARCSARPSRSGLIASRPVDSRIPTGCSLRRSTSIYASMRKARRSIGPSRRWRGFVRLSIRRSRQPCSSGAISRFMAVTSA